MNMPMRDILLLSDILRILASDPDNRHCYTVDRLTEALKKEHKEINSALVLAYLEPLQDGKIVQVIPRGPEGEPFIEVIFPPDIRP